jgi:MFS transporter, OFA family, oxalate/formate antiporter
LGLTDPLLIKRKFIAAVAVMIQLCLGTTYAWSIFKIPMIVACGWSEVQTQSVYMTYGVVISLSVALGGMMADRFGPRIVSLCGGILFGSGLILGGAALQMKNLALLLTAFGVVSGIGAGWAYVSPLATLIRWFPDKRGMLTGLAVMGYGLGSFVLGNFGPAAIVNFGVPATFYAWGGVSLVILVCGALFLVNPPPSWSPPGDKIGRAHV